MSTRTEAENVKTSGPEKLLAVILTVFILIGAVWVYSQIGKISGETYDWEYGSGPGTRVEPSKSDQDALRERRIARNASWKAGTRLKRAEKAVTFTGDTYRTEIDAGLKGTAELAEYRKAQTHLAAARKAKRRADARLARTQPAASTAEANRRAAIDERRDRQQRDDRWVALLRLALVAGMLGLGYWSLSATRRRRSRMMPLALAQISAAALLAAWMAIDLRHRCGRVPGDRTARDLGRRHRPHGDCLHCASALPREANTVAKGETPGMPLLRLSEPRRCAL